MIRFTANKKYILLVLLALCFFWMQALSASASDKTAYIAQIDDEIINPITSEYLINAINKAEKDKAECIIIQLDTPGGLLASTRSIVKRIMNAEIPVIVYVSPRGSRAGSAGVFITLAANIAVMAPSTNIGAAHPVNIGGEKQSDKQGLRELLEYFKPKKDKQQEETKKGQEEQTDKDKDKDKEPTKPTADKTPDINKNHESKNPMADKILNDTVAWITGIARIRGRNVQWAVKSVTESISDSEEDALKAGVIDFIADDMDDLIEKLDGRKVKTVSKEIILSTKNISLKHIFPTLREKILKTIADPNIAYFLMLFGFYGLLYEFTHPGIGFPGIAGAISLILALYSFQSLPTNYAGLALIILGIILFIAEAQIVSYGLLALGGAVCMFLGSLMLFDTPYEFMRVSLSTIVPLVLSTALITILLMGAVFKAHSTKIMSGSEGLIGEKGIAKSKISPTGKVFAHGELWNAQSEDEIAPDDKIIIIGIEGLTLNVKKDI